MTHIEMFADWLGVSVEDAERFIEEQYAQVQQERRLLQQPLPTRADLLALDPRNRVVERDHCDCPECADAETFVRHLSANEVLALLNDPEGRELLGLEEPDATEYTATDWYIEMAMAVDPLTDRLAQNPIKLARPKTA